MAQCRKCARFDHCGMVWKRLGEEAEDVTCVGFDPVRTNADRIRAMTDEELAKFFATFEMADACPDMSGCMEEGCEQCWIYWLRQEAKE